MVAKKQNNRFDDSILKSGVGYSKSDYSKIKKIKMEYDECVKYFQQLANKHRLDKEEAAMNRDMMILQFKSACEEICPNEKELCDIVIDLCYVTEKSKQFAWDVCGETILNNLLERNNYVIHYPVLTDGEGEFEFGGEQFVMCKKTVEGDGSI